MKSKNFKEEEVLAEMENQSSEINKDTINEIIDDENHVRNKSSKLDLKRFGKLIKQLRLAVRLLKDYRSKSYTHIPWRSISLIAAAVLYFINPFDLVPDLLPVFGIADDAVLFATLFKSIQVDLEQYCAWKGLNPDEYF